MCNLRIDPEAYYLEFCEEITEILPDIVSHLNQCVEDKLLTVEQEGELPVYYSTTLGRIFLRSIAKGLDPYLQDVEDSTMLFSKAV